MSLHYEEVKAFWEYLEFYPESDEEGYDGTHDGGIKGIREDAPSSAKEQFAEYQKKLATAKENGIKL